MKLVILTTETPHHTFFVRELAKEHNNLNVVCEYPKIIKYDYKVNHDYELRRDKYEKKIWFNDQHNKLEEYASVKRFDSINSIESYEYLKNLRNCIFVVFGTRIIKKDIIDLNKNYFFNLHGGDPTKYRGLDTHLWSIYYKDFSSLVTTLHRLEEGVDTGEIVEKETLIFDKNTSLINLRILNTEACVKLVKNLIINIKNKSLKTVKQKKNGKYFSAMPTNLKEKTIRIFNQFIIDNYNND